MYINCKYFSLANHAFAVLSAGDFDAICSINKRKLRFVDYIVCYFEPLEGIAKYFYVLFV